MTDSAAPFDHVRPVEGTAVDPGVYRVVGRPDEDVVLLEVADADGSRVHTGHLERVPSTTFGTAFESAPNPDAGGVWTERLSSVLRAAGLALVLMAILVRLDLFLAPASPATLSVVGLLGVVAAHLLARHGLPSLRR